MRGRKSNSEAGMTFVELMVAATLMGLFALFLAPAAQMLHAMLDDVDRRAAGTVLHSGRTELLGHESRDAPDDPEGHDGEGTASEILLVIMTEIQEHDHEEEQHHDGACVHDDLDRGQEMGLQKHERARHGRQRSDHEEEAAHRTLRHDDTDRAADREPREQIEEERRR